MYTKEELLEIIRPVKDPELDISIVDLGLIYEANQEENGNVNIVMTLTSPVCPLGPEIRDSVAKALQKDEKIKNVKIEWCFNPAWDPQTMASEDAKWDLGIYL